MRKVLILLALLLAPALAQAQTTDSIRKNTKFTVVVDHDGADVQGFRLYENGAIKATMTATSAGCTGTVPCAPAFSYLNGLPVGVYVFFIEAFNADGAAASTTITLTVTAGPPKAPTNPRIIK